MLDFEELRRKLLYTVCEWEFDEFFLDKFSFDEIIARLFIKEYCEKASKTTINDYSEDHPSSTNMHDTVESDRQRMYYKEVHYREANEKFCDMANELGLEIPYASHMKSIQNGRGYDNANLLLLYSLSNNGNFELLDKTLDGTILRASDETIANVYERYNERYEEAINAKDDPMEYITHWIDLYRCESRMAYSIISEIADYIIANKKKLSKHYNTSTQNTQKRAPSKKLAIPYENFSLLWGTFLDSSFTKPLIFEPYQILSYHEYIPQLFNCTKQREHNELFEQTFYKRFASLLLVSKFQSSASSFFAPFFTGNEEAISDMYHFCCYDYPVIEDHRKISFHTENKGESIINHPKIKYVKKMLATFPIVEPKKNKKSTRTTNC